MPSVAFADIRGTAQKPFVAYYGTRCLLWETSTFFLNNHWCVGGDCDDGTGRSADLTAYL